MSTTATTLLRSKIGEVRTREEWQKFVDEFWEFAELQSRYICNPRAKTSRRAFKRPEDAFERFARIVGLEVVDNQETVSWEGVF